MSPRMSPSDRAHRGSLAGPAGRVARAVCPLTLSVAMAFSVPGLAQAEPEQSPNSLATLVADEVQVTAVRARVVLPAVVMVMAGLD